MKLKGTETGDLVWKRIRMQKKTKHRTSNIADNRLQTTYSHTYKHKHTRLKHTFPCMCVFKDSLHGGMGLD